MALMTRRAMDSLLRRIYETGGLTESMEGDIRRILDDFDEREGILRKYGDVYDGDDQEEYEWRDANPDYGVERDTTIEPTVGEERDYRSDYEALKKRYLDRFFGTDRVEDDRDVIMEETEEDVKRDGTQQTYDELFKRREG